MTRSFPRGAAPAEIPADRLATLLLWNDTWSSRQGTNVRLARQPC